MKGIVLAGGSGTRLYPITKGISKQLMPIFNKPMIYYPLSTLMQAGIREILIITTAQDNEQFKRLLGDGSDFGISLEYAIQPEPKGIAQAITIGKEFIGDDSVCLILGDNIFHGTGLSSIIRNAQFNAENRNDATVFGYWVDDARRYGVAKFNKKDKCDVKDAYYCLEIEEKPKKPKSHYAVVGLYVYPNNVVNLVDTIEPSERGELEITALNNAFTKNEYNHLCINILPRGFAWLDTGTFESMSDASNYIEAIERRQGLKVACLEEIAYANGWLSKKRLIEIGESMGNNEYGQYLLKIANNEY